MIEKPIRQKIVERLRQAVAEGERHTRAQWAKMFNISYVHLCRCAPDEEFHPAFLPLRAEPGPMTILHVSQNRHGRTRVITVPACAVDGAGFNSEAELRLDVEPGKITISRDES